MAILLETTNGNLLLNFVPESAETLVFGMSLVALAIILRWVLSIKKDETGKKRH